MFGFHLPFHYISNIVNIQQPGLSTDELAGCSYHQEHRAAGGQRKEGGGGGGGGGEGGGGGLEADRDLVGRGETQKILDVVKVPARRPRGLTGEHPAQVWGGTAAAHQLLQLLHVGLQDGLVEGGGVGGGGGGGEGGGGQGVGGVPHDGLTLGPPAGHQEKLT